MSHIQIRNVSPDVHRRLKARAAQAGMTLSDYLQRELTGLARRPTMDELMERIRRRRPPLGKFDSAALVRSEREARE